VLLHLDVREEHAPSLCGLLFGAALGVAWAHPGRKVSEFIVADHVAFTRVEADFGLHLPSGAHKADEHSHDAHVHDVPTVPPTTFLNESKERDQRVLRLALFLARRNPRSRAADKLLNDDRHIEGRKRDGDCGKGAGDLAVDLCAQSALKHRGLDDGWVTQTCPKHKMKDQGYQQSTHREGKGQLEGATTGLSPPKKRCHPHQGEDEEANWSHPLVVKRRSDGHLLTDEEFAQPGRGSGQEDEGHSSE